MKKAFDQDQSARAGPEEVGGRLGQMTGCFCLVEPETPAAVGQRYFAAGTRSAGYRGSDFAPVFDNAYQYAKPLDRRNNSAVERAIAIHMCGRDEEIGMAPIASILEPCIGRFFEW